MNVSTTLLVLLMFTSIVGIGIANILMTFAAQVSAVSGRSPHRLGIAWLTVLLLTFLSMFWNSTVLIGRDDWQYGLFLFVILGPVLLVFAGSLMAQLLVVESEGQADDRTDAALTRFFTIFALVQVWFIGMDYVLGTGWTLATSISAILCVVAATLALVRNENIVLGFTAAVLGLSAIDIFIL